MLKLKKISGTLLAAAMVLSSLGVAVSADSEVVVQYATDYYGYTLYDDGTLDYKIYKGDKWGINTYLSGIDEDYLALIKTVNVDFSEFDKQSYVSFRYSLHGANCDAEQINIITSDTFYFRELIFCDFPSIDGDEDCINLSEKAHSESYRFVNVGFETLDVISKFNPAIFSIDDCEKLETAVVPAGVQVISFDSGNVSEIDFSECADTLESFGITNNSKITSFDLSDLTGLDYFCFHDCENLSDVTLPQGITMIQYAAFLDCWNLKSIELPDSVVGISSNAFAGTGLESIVIPEGVDEINPGTFKDCHNLMNVYIPSSVTRIASDAFKRDTSIKVVNFGGAEEKWNEITVDHYDYEQDKVVEDKMKDVFSDMFGDSVLYCNADGIDGWRKADKSWLYYDENGSKTTGWKQIDGTWYDFDSNGIMLTGWQESGSDWYYMNGSGAMVTGWIQSSGKWYFMDKSSGAMKTGWLNDGGAWYYFNGSGAMVTGWVEISGKWYFFESSGAMKTGWIQSSGDWYCLKSDGSMAAGEYVRGYWLNANGKWTYEYKFTWKQDSVGWYYIDTNGWYVKSDSVMIDGKVYDFDSRGYCTNP